ncbi:uncharacterized protein LOC133717897 [Rosa rugosa]|uniref:uncharacterized protein LOC133717897 n=1 Tax=Rosa rugosa TaxID=74645 RepID=UPI002B4068C4|nr:uncharacterized protein LOC133717897 [Rosa rugosa]
MAILDNTTFEIITPSRFTTFSLRVAVLDSPPTHPESPECSSPNTASPTGYSPPTPAISSSSSGVSLKPLFLALSPKSKSCFKHGIPEIPILSYQDNLISSLVLEKCVGCLVGEMVVEDVEIDSGGEVSTREFRRRLRFRRMPNLIQTEVLRVFRLWVWKPMRRC